MSSYVTFSMFTSTSSSSNEEMTII